MEVCRVKAEWSGAPAGVEGDGEHCGKLERIGRQHSDLRGAPQAPGVQKAACTAEGRRSGIPALGLRERGAAQGRLGPSRQARPFGERTRRAEF